MIEISQIEQIESTVFIAGKYKLFNYFFYMDILFSVGLIVAGLILLTF